MNIIHTFSDGFGEGHAFPMWPQIIAASGFDVINYSEVSISIPEMLDLFYKAYNPHDRFLIQLPESGRIIGTRKPAKVDPTFYIRDQKLLTSINEKNFDNVDIMYVQHMDKWSRKFPNRGDEVQPQPIIHARWLKEYFPDLIDDKIYKKIEHYGTWEPYYWDREQEWKNLIL